MTTTEALRLAREALKLASDELAACPVEETEWWSKQRPVIARCNKAIDAIDALPTTTTAIDVERMLTACVPCGSSCDPKHVADSIRAYFSGAASAKGAAASVAGPHDWMWPTTVHARMSEAVSLLCAGSRPPAEMVAGWLCDSEDHRLQEFAIEHGPAWAQGIALLDAALIMANQPAEGEGHELAAPHAAPAPAIIEQIAQWLETQRNDIPATGAEFAAALRARYCAQSTAVAEPEPDMRHPEIQRLIGAKARREIELQLVGQLLDEGPGCGFTSMDMEHWGPLHDRLTAALEARGAQDGQTIVPGGYASWEHLARALQGEVDRLTACVNAGTAHHALTLTPAQVDLAVLAWFDGHAAKSYLGFAARMRDVAAAWGVTITDTAAPKETGNV